MYKILMIIFFLITTTYAHGEININITKTQALEMQYSAIIKELCSKYGFDVCLIKAIIRVESAFNSKAVSPDYKSFGLMQLTKGTAKRFGVKNIYDPYENIHGGIKYLDYLRRLFKNDVVKILAAYNLGERRVLGKTIPPQGLEYAKLVLHCKTKYEKRN